MRPFLVRIDRAHEVASLLGRAVPPTWHGVNVHRRSSTLMPCRPPAGSRLSGNWSVTFCVGRSHRVEVGGETTWGVLPSGEKSDDVMVVLPGVPSGVQLNEWKLIPAVTRRDVWCVSVSVAACAAIVLIWSGGARPAVNCSIWGTPSTRLSLLPYTSPVLLVRSSSPRPRPANTEPPPSQTSGPRFEWLVWRAAVPSALVVSWETWSETNAAHLAWHWHTNPA